MIFLVFFTFFYFLYVLSLGICIKNNKLLLISSLIPVTLISGFRYNVGFDFLSYVNYFDLLKYNEDVYLDFSFRYLSYAILYINGNEQLLFITYAILYSIALYFLIQIASKNYADAVDAVFIIGLILSFYAFYFLLTLNQIRSTLSAIFLCYAFLRERKDFAFYFSVFLSVFFHSAALFLIPIYFMLSRVNIKFLLCMFPFLIILSYFNVFSGLIRYILILFDSRFVNYFDSEYFLPKEGVEKFYSILSMSVIIVIVMTMTTILPKKFESVVKLVICFLLLRAMSIDIMIFARLSDFLKPIAIILIFTMIYKASQKVKPNIILPLYFLGVLSITLLNVYLGSNISHQSDYDYEFNICIFGSKCVS
ncbi:EpsG family protein [Citrobacter amalonaticus]|uniref:EpsG family protein n=1 Tax=Citrobacter amalonaticus TaxID=35703 RepID=UPI0031F32A86